MFAQQLSDYIYAFAQHLSASIFKCLPSSCRPLYLYICPAAVSLCIYTCIRSVAVRFYIVAFVQQIPLVYLYFAKQFSIFIFISNYCQFLYLYPAAVCLCIFHFFFFLIIFTCIFILNSCQPVYLYVCPAAVRLYTFSHQLSASVFIRLPSNMDEVLFNILRCRLTY